MTRFQIPSEAVCVSHSFNILGKGMGFLFFLFFFFFLHPCWNVFYLFTNWLLFLSWPLERPFFWGEGAMRPKVFLDLSGPTLKKALCRTYPVVGRRTNKILFIYFRVNGQMSRVFANGSGDRSSIPGRVIPKTQKVVLDASLLNIQHCKVRIKGKVEQSRE